MWNRKMLRGTPKTEGKTESQNKGTERMQQHFALCFYQAVKAQCLRR